MLFTYKNHPVLEKLKTGKLGKIRFSEDQADYLKENAPAIRGIWEFFSPMFRRRVVKLSDSFCESMERAAPSFLKLGKDIWDEPMKEPGAGTVIFGKAALCYYFSWQEDGSFSYAVYRFVDDIFQGFGSCRMEEGGPKKFS